MKVNFIIKESFNGQFNLTIWQTVENLNINVVIFKTFGDFILVLLITICRGKQTVFKFEISTQIIYKMARFSR